MAQEVWVVYEKGNIAISERFDSAREAVIRRDKLRRKGVEVYIHSDPIIARPEIQR